MNQPAVNPLLTPKQVSQAIGIAEDTLTVWRSTGRWNLPFVKIGRKVMYDSKDIQAFIDKRKRTQTA